MRIHVVGKVHRHGTSAKSGRAYDFVEVHFVAPKRGVVGEAAQTMTMDPQLYSFDNITPGVYEVQFDNSGTLLSMAPVQAQPVVSK